MDLDLKIYEYSKCSTCRKARQFLDRKKLSYKPVPIIECPPSLKELRRAAHFVGGFKKLFNTSGQVYRELGLRDKIAAMSEEEATVEEVIEPYLIQLGLLERTARGRVATKKAHEHLEFDFTEKQSKLL